MIKFPSNTLRQGLLPEYWFPDGWSARYQGSKHGSLTITIRPIKYLVAPNLSLVCTFPQNSIKWYNLQKYLLFYFIIYFIMEYWTTPVKSFLFRIASNFKLSKAGTLTLTENTGCCVLTLVEWCNTTIFHCFSLLFFLFFSLFSMVQTFYLNLSCKIIMLNITQISAMKRTTQFLTDWQSTSDFSTSHLPTNWRPCPLPVSQLILLMAPSYTRQESESVRFSWAILCNFYTLLSSQSSQS